MNALLPPPWSLFAPELASVPVAVAVTELRLTGVCARNRAPASSTTINSGHPCKAEDADEDDGREDESESSSRSDSNADAAAEADGRLPAHGGLVANAMPVMMDCGRWWIKNREMLK